MKPIEYKLIISLSISILLTILLSSLFLLGVFSNIQVKLVDNLYGDKKPLDKIILIGIDDKSLQEIGRWPWPRERFIEILDKLENTSVIGIDVAFYEEYNKDIDQELANKLKNFNVVLAAEYTFDSSRDILLPIEKLQNSAKFGYTNVYTDKDGITRSIPHNLGSYNSFSAETYKQYIGKELEFEGSRILINFVDKPGTFKTFSFVDVVNNKIDQSIFDGSIVLIGATALDLHDNYFVPTSKGIAMSGIEIHANALQTMLNSNFLNKQSNLSVIILMFLASILFSLVTYRFNITTTFSIMLAILFLYFLASVYFFNKEIILNIIYVPLSIILTPIANLVLFYTIEKRHKKKIVEAFGKYVSPIIVEEIAKKPELVRLGGEKRNITIMFSDIRGFTTISEKLVPEQLVNLLNEYLSAMTQIISDNKGLVDKFIGDAIMAFWGAPLEEPNHEKLACETSVKMLKKLEELQVKWRRENMPNIDIGIGINSGEAIIGNMGSSQRFDYTAIGDTVNLASRLEGINKQYKTHIIISESTYKKIKDNFLTRELDAVKVKGKSEPIKIYELIEYADEKTKKIIHLFENGLKLYKKQKWDEAIKEFNKVLELKDDKASSLYIERCNYLKKYPPGNNWQAIHEMETK